MSTDGAVPSYVETEKATGSPSQNWTEIVAQIQAGDPAGVEQLYRVFTRGLRYILARQVAPQDVEDKMHEILLIVVRAIQSGDLREPERVMGFVRAVMSRQIAHYIDGAVRKRQRESDPESPPYIPDVRLSPEQEILKKERVEIMKETLETMAPRCREILERFYLREQRPEQICREMSLTETQFRLLKSRAKAQLGDRGQRRLKLTVRFLGN
ncbi:MAG TPA: sigma-70 family RNA polymerase sigma factor [Bryobacteraceae bacterium]|nr:sigma-70 family RNA polymerase sigma factor [Bryobacteraceae bacterium]